MPPKGSPLPQEADAGYEQAGCVIALVSAPLGAVAGAVIAFVGDSPLPLSEVTILAASVGFVGGFYVLGWLAPRLLALVPATRARAVELGTYGAALLSGLVALLTWPVVAIVGLEDPTQILWLAAGIMGVAIVGSSVVMLIVIAVQHWLSSSKRNW